jgi:hypothetical protein
MKKLEKRIQALVRNRPGIKSSKIIEYLGMNPGKVINTLEGMKKKGTLVGKPVKGEFVGVADNIEVIE